MPAKDRNLPINCEKCVKSFVKAHIARHRKTCMMGTLYCKKKNYNFATKNAAEFSYHIAKAHGAKIRITLNKCVVCQKQFPSFYSLQLHRKKVHQASTEIGSSSTNPVREIMQKVDNDSESLKEEHWQRVSIYLTICMLSTADRKFSTAVYLIWTPRR